jgi:hypothetical protein
VAAFVGLPEDDPFVVSRRNEVGQPYHHPFERTSTAAALRRNRGQGDFAATADWAAQQLATSRVTLDDLAERAGGDVDFVKSDTDGGDLEVLLSGHSLLARPDLLGVLVEAAYTGSDAATSNTFHNVDRLMKERGFSLFSCSVYRYSRDALPGEYLFASLTSPTIGGQPQWGDFLYMRDAAAPDYMAVQGGLAPAKLLKLAALFDLFRLPDCAAELLVTFRPKLDRLVDVDELLDLLTPPLRGASVTYREYVDAVHADPTLLFPRTRPRESNARISADYVDALERQLAAIETSTAWRITKPLRLVAHTLRGRDPDARRIVD